MYLNLTKQLYFRYVYMRLKYLSGITKGFYWCLCKQQMCLNSYGYSPVFYEYSLRCSKRILDIFVIKSYSLRGANILEPKSKNII